MACPGGRQPPPCAESAPRDVSSQAFWRRCWPVIMLVTFGLWNWVDGQLDKQPWLSDKANTSGTSWLILGSDQRTGEEAKTITGFRTDTILVLTKPNSGTRSLISIPRDSLVQVNGTYMKINAVGPAVRREGARPAGRDHHRSEDRPRRADQVQRIEGCGRRVGRGRPVL